MNIKGTIFVAGIYGVGKTTLCDSISERIKIPHYSASDLISLSNKEQYGANKFVQNVKNNQEILVSMVQEILMSNEGIILSGHFCIFNKVMGVEVLPREVFRQLSICKIVLLEADRKTLMKHLVLRDNQNYDAKAISTLANAERYQAGVVAEEFSIPVFHHQMRYNANDIEAIKKFICKE